MLAASSVTSLGTALPRTVVLSTLLARPATNVVKLVTVRLPFLPLLSESANHSLVSRDCPQKATNGDLTAETVDLGVAPVPSVAPVA